MRQLPPHGHETKQAEKCCGNRKCARGARVSAHAYTRSSEGAAFFGFFGGFLGQTMAELGEADEAELQRLVAAEQQKAQFTAQVHHFMELCWDKCVEKPGNRLDSRTENCLSSCVDRFIDTTLAITSRFAQMVQKGGQ
ncbi:mitochondrial import inner membrane translocase subunit Tim8 B [Tupaia chinensis]|nr:mitochondrial import inner membrane translocase subunit Tim8 B [Tupaia chinensis]